MLWLKRGLLIAAVFIFFMLVTAPAALVNQLMPATPGLSLGHASGTLWHGKMSRLEYKGVVVSPVRWQWQPRSLLTGGAAFEVTLGKRGSDVRGGGILGVSPSGAFSEEFEVSLPAESLGRLVKLPMRAKASGRLTLSLAEARQGQPWCDTLDGQLSIDQGRLSGAGMQLPIEQLVMTLGCRDGQLTSRLTPESNSLGLDVELALQANNQVEISGHLASTAEQPKELRQLLRFLPKPDAKGRYALKYSGPIPGL